LISLFANSRFLPNQYALTRLAVAVLQIVLKSRVFAA